MATPTKQPTGGSSEALETVCGWALCAGVAYALLFVNLTGDGPLWGSLVGSIQDAVLVPVSDAPTRSYVIPAKPVDADTQAQNRMLMVPDDTDALVVTVQDPSRRPIAALTDAPADPAAARAPVKDWRVHIQGQLPAVAVYGPGEETSSAVAGTAPAAVRPAASAPADAAAGSAYRAGVADATPRPDISGRLTAMRAQSGDGVQNFLGR